MEFSLKIPETNSKKQQNLINVDEISLSKKASSTYYFQGQKNSLLVLGEWV